jgi:hypothetical protein
LMGNNRIQNLKFFFIFFVSYATLLVVPFIQKSLALRRVDSI